MSQDKQVIISGEQQAEIDARALARAILLLARHLHNQQIDSPHDGRNDPATGGPRTVEQPVPMNEERP